MGTTKAGLRELETVASKGWSDDVPLDELLVRVNRVAAKLLPVLPTTDSRINPTLIPRTFRHYVTLGCIDQGRRDGRKVHYDYRHFLQALLVRRLLGDGVTARMMPELVATCDNDELKCMILDGVQLQMQSGAAKEEGDTPVRDAVGAAERWSRTRIAPGVELHLRDDLPRFKPAAIRQLTEQLERVLKRHGR